MPATIEKEDGMTIIELGEFRLMDGALFQRQDNYWKAILWEDSFDDLYAVLHARHVAQHYNAELMARIEKAVEAVKDDDLYGGEG